ncbi:MAG: OmpA family protein [Bacteroidota bacterium]
MRVTETAVFVVLLLFFRLGFSQDIQITKKDSIVQSAWIFGVGFNAVDDAGSEFSDVFNVSDNWNIVPFPSRLSIGRYFKNGLGLEAIGTYNRYKEGKTIDGIINTEDIDYYALDLRISYDLNQILGETAWFDPYVGIGAGYTDANNQGRGTYNASVGFRTWFSDRFGLDFNSTGKWAMSTENATNHIQHAAGAVYRFGIEKGLSKKGEEKLALMKEMEKEQQRIQDSIAAVQRAEEEARLLAERLENEKEATRLAAEEKAKKEAEKARGEKIKKEIDGLGNIMFSLNSSYLTENDKVVMGKLVQILNDYPAVRIAIEGHADSRGGDKYNQWLSERRAKRAAEYILSLGVTEDRISYDGFGETRLTNECDDSTPCSGEKHSENRRVEFVVKQWN